MCSSPRPKRKIKIAKSVKSGGALANMTMNARQSFANKANLADEKRHKLIVAKKTSQQSHIIAARRVTKQKKSISKTVKKSWYYWLAHASLTQIISKLLGQHKRQVN